MSDVAAFRELLGKHLGLSFDDSKSDHLGEVLARRARAAGLTPLEYVARFDGNPQEVGALAEELTVGETYFFRNADQFAALTRGVLPARIAARARDRCLHLLSAGCASGEEAYSLAIAVRNAVDPTWTTSVRGVDINPAAIARGRRARYTSWALRETPTDAQARWFCNDGRELVLAPEVRDAVQLEVRNLALEDLELWRPATYDVVFCRNVLMYLKPEVTRDVVARIARALVPGGYLFLGHAETLRGVSTEFHLCHTHNTFYYEKRGDTPAPREPVQVPAVAPAELRTAVDTADTWVEAIRKASERIRSLTATVPAQAATTWDLALVLELIREERYGDALATIRALPPGADNDPNVLLLLSVLHVQGGEPAVAEAACKRLLAIDELHAGAHYVLALCRESAGDRQGAIEHDQIAAYLDPQFAMPHLHLGLMARRAGDVALARSSLARAAVLFAGEDPSRLLLFGGGFRREALVALCQAELEAVK